jgi:Fe-S cluster biogenesis protein NfuA
LRSAFSRNPEHADPLQVRAVVQEDGGNITFKRWDPDSGIVWVQMEGACVGCTMSKDTLHNGVLRLLQHYVPEVKEVCENPSTLVEQVS